MAMPLLWGRCRDIPSGARVFLKSKELFFYNRDSEEPVAALYGLTYHATATKHFRRQDGRLERLFSNLSFRVGEHPNHIWLEV